MLFVTRSTLEAISKPQMAFEGKAKADEKAQHTREYVSILKRLSTQPSGVRWGFEMASNTSSNRCLSVPRHLEMNNEEDEK